MSREKELRTVKQPRKPGKKRPPWQERGAAAQTRRAPRRGGQR